MSKLTVCSIALACTLAGTLSAAENDPFCGKWTLNQAKSKVVGEQMKIDDLGGNKYKITFGNVSDTITADGTDQPGRFGETTAITPEGSKEWKMVIKKDGKTTTSMTHKLSDDGQAQTIQGTNYKPDGTTFDYTVKLKRISSGSGWAGTWESTQAKISSPPEFDIESYEGDGLSLKTPAYQDTLSMKFDGKDYEEKGPQVAPGSMSSGKRIDLHTLAVTDKVKGEVMDHAKFQVSDDGKTLTITVRATGQPHAASYVYDKM